MRDHAAPVMDGCCPEVPRGLRAGFDRQIALHLYVSLKTARDLQMPDPLDFPLDGQAGGDDGVVLWGTLLHRTARLGRLRDALGLLGSRGALGFLQVFLPQCHGELLLTRAHRPASLIALVSAASSYASSSLWRLPQKNNAL